MTDPHTRHEPTDGFVTRLESQIAGEIRRRNHNATAPRWASWSALQVGLAATVLVVVSMALGGAAVAASYESQNNELRAQLIASYTQRADLARQRRDLATKEEKAAQTRFNVGLADDKVLLEKSLAVVTAQAELAKVELELEEIKLSGAEPKGELYSPRVSGRDFVGERLRIELSVFTKTLDVEKRVAQDVAARVEIGTYAQVDLDAARARVQAVEAGERALQRQITIRQMYLGGKIDAVEAQLRGLESEAEHKTASLAPEIALAAKEVARLTQRVDAGTAQPVDLAEAKLRKLELETALSKAELDLALIRRRLDQHRKRE